MPEPPGVYTHFFVGTFPQLETRLSTPNKDLTDPLAPRREAALFYGLFLRGHSIESLRRDIDVPVLLHKKWTNGNQYEGNFRDNLRQLYDYRKQVLAIFDELVLNERGRARIQ